MYSARFTLHVPLVDNHGLDVEDYHAHVRAVLSRKPLPGGWTAITAEGGWRGTVDPVRLYMVDVPGTGLRELPVLLDLARIVKRDLDQEAVYLTPQSVNGFESWLI